MRIVQVLSAPSTVGVTGSRIWLRNLYEPLLELGHEVILIPADDGWRAAVRGDTRLRDQFSEKVRSTVVAAAQNGGVDLFFSYLIDGAVDPALIDEIGDMGIPTCNFSCNNTHQFDLVDSISPHFEINAHSEKDAAESFRAVGANPVWFPMAANAKYYHPVETACDMDVTFVGQRYALRPGYVGRLLDTGIDVHVYGPGWRLRTPGLAGEAKRILRRAVTEARALLTTGDVSRGRAVAESAWLREAERVRLRYSHNMHDPVPDDEMIRLYSASRVSLGFSEVFDAHDPSAEVKRHLHLRDFEAPMCGAAYLAGRTEELGEFYELETEVATYGDPEELIAKTRFLLSNSSARHRLREAGLKRARACHTYQRRLSDLFSSIGVG
jgi:spore maturation protein CgeB